SFRLWLAPAFVQAHALTNARMATLRPNTRAFRFTSTSPNADPGCDRNTDQHAPLNTSAPTMSRRHRLGKPAPERRLALSVGSRPTIYDRQIPGNGLDLSVR